MQELLNLRRIFDKYVLTVWVARLHCEILGMNVTYIAANVVVVDVIVVDVVVDDQDGGNFWFFLFHMQS